MIKNSISEFSRNIDFITVVSELAGLPVCIKRF